MATMEIDIGAILRELINQIIDEFTVDEAYEVLHFEYDENHEGIDNENDQEHIDEEQVPENINDKKDPAGASSTLSQTASTISPKRVFTTSSISAGHIEKKEVSEDINNKKDPEDIYDVVNTLLSEMIEAVCDKVVSEAMTGGDVKAVTVTENMKETPAKDQCKERNGDGLVRTTETEAPKAAELL